MAPARHADNSRRERFPTEWAMECDRQTQPSKGAGIDPPPIQEIGRSVRRETTRPDLELDGVA
jgi:hypothetical protein